MSDITAELDKSLASSLSEDFGFMTIRVVVLKKVQDDEPPEEQDETPADAGPEEVFDHGAKTPVSGYLESSKRGKECCVFLVNGQRQDAWDNTFVVRDLGMKYLRNRMLVVVDLDGLRPEAMSRLMSGDRQSFFQGEVYHAISQRLVATLKRDPDLERLEEEAEREVSELEAGDDAVKSALDQLIETHHSMADHVSEGQEQAGVISGGSVTFGKDRKDDVVVGPQATGTPTTGPYLVASVRTPSLRLHPNESTTLTISTEPAAAWADVRKLHIELSRQIEGLVLEPQEEVGLARIRMQFTEPDDWEDDYYPAETGLRVTAILEGQEDPRLLQRRVIISKPKTRPPRPTPTLLDAPTFLRVTSRQPIPIIPGGPDSHVRLRWDGKDELAAGPQPKWRFSARCLSSSTFPAITFSNPSNARFELLLNAPSLTTGDLLEFEVTATGPAGEQLRAEFKAQAIAPPQPEPKRLKASVPELVSQRRPPYILKYVSKENWETGFWENNSWTGGDAACFHDPTETKPLFLVINKDMDLLRQYQEALVSRKLEPATISERVTRYTSHVAFHLYQMYENYRARQDANRADDSISVPSTQQMQGEVNRVAATLLKVMQVSR